MTTDEKLAEIIMLATDAWHFAKLRGLIMEMEKRAEQGDEDAEKICNIVDTYYSLCKFVQRNS